MLKFSKREFFAFTLAEVLITLSVIGVVAAMTLPTLIKEYQKHVWVNQLKKSYSMWEQAFQKMLADDEVSKLSDTSVWASKGAKNCKESNLLTDTNCQNFVNNLGKYIKIVGVEEYGNKIYKLGGSVLANYTTSKSLALTDGTMILIKDSSASTRSKANCDLIKSSGGNMCSKVMAVYIDVNGQRRPNISGRDVFSFLVSDEGKLYPYGGKDMALWDWNGKALDENTSYWRKSTSRCGTPDSSAIESKNAGTGCAARIMENGWKMDY